jgi:hypothetical protein
MLLHKLSRPSAILERIGQTGTLWSLWKPDAQMRDWLYGGRLPANIPIHYPCRMRQGRKPEAGAFEAPPEMWSFRREATINAICRAARISKRMHRRLRDRDHASYLKYLHRHREVDWFRNWLLRGTSEPPDVKTATPNQIQRASRAWDFVVMRQHPDVRVSEAAFERWFRNGLIPDGDRRTAFVDWLYGAELAAWTVITEPMRRLRGERTTEGICAAAKVSQAAVNAWRNDPARKEALAFVLQAARKSTRSRPESLIGEKAWGELDPRTRDAMWRFAQAANLTRCAERARVFKQEYGNWLRYARRLSGDAVADRLKRYLDGEPDASFRSHGILMDKLYFPTPAMLRFRKIARGERARQNISGLMSELPCVQQWMLAWAVPHSNKRTKVIETQAITPPRKPEPRVEPIANMPQLGGDGAVLPPAPMLPPLPPAVFLPSAFQMRILDELDQTALTADELQDRLDVNRTWLFAGGLKPLMAAGRIINKRPFGYLRPDRLPPKIGKFLV